MSTKKLIQELSDLAVDLLTTIDDELWDDAKRLSQLWDVKIRTFISNLPAEEFITLQDEIEKIASNNTKIENHLVTMRAKVLTKIQNNNNSRTAIEQYNSSV